MIDFRMRTFLELCKQRSYTKTAEILCITQPAVTQHIKYIEQYYGEKLFCYEGRKLELTKQGDILYHAALTMAADEKKLKELLNSPMNQKQNFHFGCTLTIGEFVLPDKLIEFIKKHPFTQLSMIVDNTFVLLDKLKKGEIEFAFIEGYFNEEEYEFRPFQKERFIAVSSESDLYQTGMSLKQLQNQSIIVREPGSGTREVLERILYEKNIELNNFQRVIQIGNINAIKKLAVNGCGITFLYESAVRDEIKRGLLYEIRMEDVSMNRELHFVMLKNSRYANEYKDFLKQIQQV